MAKVKYDVRGVESGRDFADLKPGTYPGEIIEATERESAAGNDMIELVLKLGGEAKGAQLWYYVVTSDESMKFRVKELTEALGLPEKGTLDTDKIVGKKVNVKTRMGKDENNEPRPEVSRLSTLKGEDEEGDDDGDEDGEDYSDLDLDALKEKLEEREIEFVGKVTKKKAITALEADDDDDDEDEDDDDDDDDDEDAVDLDALNRKQLKAYIEKEELDITVKKKMSDDDIRVAIAEAADDEDDDDDDDDDDDGEDYSSQGVAELKAELEKRGLKSNGKKSVLVKRLEKDDESDDGDPF